MVASGEIRCYFNERALEVHLARKCMVEGARSICLFIGACAKWRPAIIFSACHVLPFVGKFVTTGG